MSDTNPQSEDRTSPGALAFGQALEYLGWGKAAPLKLANSMSQTTKSEVNAVRQASGNPHCLVESCLSRSRASACPVELNREGRRNLSKLSELGITVTDVWPRSWWPSIENWLGYRLYVGHRWIFAHRPTLVSLVSSRLGKGERHLPHWPILIQRALQFVKRRNERLLLVHDSASDAIVRQFVSRYRMDCVDLEVSGKQTQSAVEWLATHIESFLRSESPDVRPAIGRLAISDELPIRKERDFLTTEFEKLPQQDRLMFALADRILVIHSRPGGTIETLMAERLRDPQFPSASLYVAVSDSNSIPDAARVKPANAWLARGAVGWYFRSTANSLFEFTCRLAQVDSAVRQLTLPARISAIFKSAKPPQHLVHCTRSSSGPGPQESQAQHRDRVFLQGEVDAPSPLLSLIRIIRQRRIIGSERLIRASIPAVSFSAVPLPSLLSRRIYQGHLNRWDWEPYGLLIRCEAIEKYGAKPVIYGNDEQYAALPQEERPWFQPLERNSQRYANWIEECEWRVLGDVWLNQLPSDAITVFVRTAQEAEFVARESPWPVIWVESATDSP